jgi:hypothetical protein
VLYANKLEPSKVLINQTTKVVVCLTSLKPAFIFDTKAVLLVLILLQDKFVEELIRSCLFDVHSVFEAMPVVWLAVSDGKANF